MLHCFGNSQGKVIFQFLRKKYQQNISKKVCFNQTFLKYLLYYCGSLSFLCPYLIFFYSFAYILIENPLKSETTTRDNNN